MQNKLQAGSPARHSEGKKAVAPVPIRGHGAGPETKMNEDGIQYGHSQSGSLSDLHQKKLLYSKTTMQWPHSLINCTDILICIY